MQQVSEYQLPALPIPAHLVQEFCTAHGLDAQYPALVERSKLTWSFVQCPRVWFGKHKKDDPTILQVALKDLKYLQWLAGQEWFQTEDQYAELRNWTQRLLTLTAQQREALWQSVQPNKSF